MHLFKSTRRSKKKEALRVNVYEDLIKSVNLYVQDILNKTTKHHCVLLWVDQCFLIKSSNSIACQIRSVHHFLFWLILIQPPTLEIRTLNIRQKLILSTSRLSSTTHASHFRIYNITILGNTCLITHIPLQPTRPENIFFCVWHKTNLE